MRYTEFRVWRIFLMESSWFCYAEMGAYMVVLQCQKMVLTTEYRFYEKTILIANTLSFFSICKRPINLLPKFYRRNLSNRLDT